MHINLAHSLDSMRSSYHNGPNRRVSFWVQGCSLRCTTKCLNSHMLVSNEKNRYSVASIIEQIQQIHTKTPIEGITVLGGEPSEQSEALSVLLQKVQQLGFSTMVYTGHIYEEFDKSIHDWLTYTDILVDGPFLEEEYDTTIPWRGSKNQRILCLSERYTEQSLQEAFQKYGKGFSIKISPDGEISVSGIQVREGALKLQRLITKMSKNK